MRSLTSAVIATSTPAATSIIDSASSSARASVFMKAPEPNGTVITRPLMPAASFLAMIEPVISGMLSTVALTSRT